MRILLAAFVVCAALAQQRPSTVLVVRVAPEAHVNPPQVTLNFQVSADPTASITTQTVALSAWVRAQAGRPIRLTGTLAGSTPVVWTGSVAQASAGGRQAGCTTGSFSSSPTQDLASNWQTSGTLTCLLTFSLPDPQNLAPGSYSATLTFAAQ